VDRYRVDGVDYLKKDAFCPLVMMDNEDPWGMTVRSYRKLAGRFRLMSREDGTRFSGATARTLPSVRVVEDGPVRAVVEAVLSFGDSFICQRYKLPKDGTEIELEVRVHWNEKNRCLKLSVPVKGKSCEYLGQVAYGIAPLFDDGTECVAQKWTAAVCRDTDQAVTFINEGTYGSDFSRDGVRLTLLRSPAYSGHPFFKRPIVRQDRYLPRIDQGERVFRFWINAGPVRSRLNVVDREALTRNEKPFALSFYPPGIGRKPKAGPRLSDAVVQLTCLKRAESGNDLIVRLHEPTGRKRTTTLSLPFIPFKTRVTLNPFEIRTLRINPRTPKAREVNLLERGKG
jgi:alpha-mannosidase